MLLRARWVIPVASEPIEDGAVVIRAGRILDVGPARVACGRHPEERVLDLGDAAILPGFVNAHAHLEITLLRGFLDGLPFFDWWRGLVRLKLDGLKASELIFHSLLGAAEMLRAGITCVADCGDSGAPFDALAVSGLRGIVFQEVFAPAEGDVPSALRRFEERLDALQAMADDRVGVGVSPHSPYMACPRLLDDVARLAADRSLPVSLHVAESAAEVDFLADGTGPIADHFRTRGWPVEAPGLTPVEHLAARGWLDLPVPVQLVHLARAGASDLALLRDAAARGARLGIAACVRSNAALGNGIPDLRALADTGVPVGLGTDGAPAVGACDALSEVRFALLAQRARGGARFEARTALRHATLDAARSLGLAAEIGSLEPGKRADVCAVSLASSRAAPAVDPEAAVVLAATPDDVVLTVVDGEVVWDGREIRTIDEEQVRHRCAERAHLLRRMQ